MADGHRKYPVNRIVMHHSAGLEFVNSTDLEVQDWFDRVGKGRGYAGRSRSYHKHPSRNKETFSQAHYALRAYTKDKNKYGWRLTLLIADPWNNVAWHASNWPINKQSIGIETCGNYVNKKLPLKALMLVADTFRFQDKKLNGKFWINGHKDFVATACPGQIYGQLPTLIDMINNPSKWNEKLWPAPKPDPKPEPKPEPVDPCKDVKEGLERCTEDKKRLTVDLNKAKKELEECERDLVNCKKSSGQNYTSFVNEYRKKLATSEERLRREIDLIMKENKDNPDFVLDIWKDEIYNRVGSVGLIVDGIIRLVKLDRASSESKD